MLTAKQSLSRYKTLSLYLKRLLTESLWMRTKHIVLFWYPAQIFQPAHEAGGRCQYQPAFHSTCIPQRHKSHQCPRLPRPGHNPYPKPGQCNGESGARFPLRNAERIAGRWLQTHKPVHVVSGLGLGGCKINSSFLLAELCEQLTFSTRLQPYRTNNSALEEAKRSSKNFNSKVRTINLILM